jgi:4-diphosphocytidyl-2-C-methyl-D-erythritol kinase
VTAGPLVEPARAKVNLALHVVGRRDDGYHLLDSVVVFPPVADVVRATPAPDLTLEIAGPGAGALDGTPLSANLVLRAATALRERLPSRPGAALRLDKRLPVAAGIGGGSADAAAALRLLARLWGRDPADPVLREIALGLGADVPMCLSSSPVRARGVGEVLEPLAPLPGLGIVLVNPGVALATAEVFRCLMRRDNPPIPAPPPSDAAGFVAALAACRNDLEEPARAVSPAIDRVLAAIAASPGCRLARMSGSGATCFGLYDDPAAAGEAARVIGPAHPHWWVVAAPIS